jgi:hypothetical protein
VVIQRQLQHEKAPPGSPKSGSRPAAPLKLAQLQSLEENILRVMIQHPELIGEVMESGALPRFQETVLKGIAEILTRVPYPPDGDFNPGAVYDQLPNPELKECFTRLLLDPYDLTEARLHMLDWLDAVLKRDRKQRRLDLREALRQAEQKGDQAQIRELLAEIQGLDFSKKRVTDTRDSV